MGCGSDDMRKQLCREAGRIKTKVMGRMFERAIDLRFPKSQSARLVGYGKTLRRK